MWARTSWVQIRGCGGRGMDDEEPDVQADPVRALGTVAAELFHDLASELAVVEGRVAAVRHEARQGGVPSGELEALTGDAERIRRMVQDVLDEMAGKGISPEAAFDAEPTVRQMVQSWVPTAASVHVSYASDVPGPALVRGRPSFLERAVLNLLRNAARHARSRVSVQVCEGPPTSSGQRQLDVQVEDDGAGIPSQGPGHDLFQPFVAGERERTGLGLAVVRWCAEALGGHVELADGRELPGASFRLRFPVAVAAPRWQEAQEKQPDLHGLRIAVVEDDPAVRRIFRRLLARAGANVRTLAPERPSTLADELLESEDDVVLMDINLGVVSGLEVWRDLWAHDPRRAQQVVLMTGYGPEEFSVPELDGADGPTVLSKLAEPTEIAHRLRAAATP